MPPMAGTGAGFQIVALDGMKMVIPVGFEPTTL